MTLPVFHVNAFTDGPFKGNPAAVCPLAVWLDDDLLQAVASENNLSETAFFVDEGDQIRLRWFTPRCEVSLCGHATLASGLILLTRLQPDCDSVRFITRSGIVLTVRREGELLAMDFPSLAPWACDRPPRELVEGLSNGPSFSSVQQIEDNYFVVYESEDDIRRIRPNFPLLEKLHPAGVAITAPGIDVDFVSRYFVPSYGIPEDPVTGSIHCSLAPYWAARLSKTELHARQLSARGGELWCVVAGDRVHIKGKAVLTLRGSLLI